MKIPYKPKSLPFQARTYKYIVLHDMSCMFDGMTEFYNDSKKFQTGFLRSNNFIMNNQYDLNYHFVAEMVNDDFESIIGRPMFSLCEYPDIKSPFDMALHIGIMGNFDYTGPTARTYKQLAYRILVPLMHAFKLKVGRIKLHHEVSDDEHACPGTFFKRDELMAAINSMKVASL